MKPDDVLRAVADTGGVIGMSAAPHTTLSHAHPLHTIESVMDHFTHLVDVVGIDHVAFGPDTLFGDHVGLHDAFSSNLSIGQAHGMVEFEKQPYVDGLENPAECFSNIIGCSPWAWYGPFESGDGDRHPQAPNPAHRAPILGPDNKGAGWFHPEGVRRGRLLRAGSPGCP